MELTPIVVALVQPLLALLASQNNEVAYRVILGLALIAAAWIGAGLWLIKGAERSRRLRR
ncbi:MAG: hypothetical protein JSU08_11220 [Acidobacteria bacterium]|nr:hypothetical protein [Acidobacteriota bacterium]